MAFQVEFDYGSGWVDVTNYVISPSLKRTLHAHKDLKSTINTATFDMMYNTTVVNALYGSSNVEVRIHDNDSNDWFTGYVKDQMSTTAKSRGETFSLECVDHGWDLKKPISRDTANNFPLTAPYIYKSTDTANSILYQLLVADGPLSSLSEVSDITDTVQYVDFTDDGKTYEEVVKELLFEFGYSYYFDESGNMKVLDLFPSSLSSTATFSTAARNIKTELKIERSQEQHDAVRVKYDRISVVNNALVYRETRDEEGVIDYVSGPYFCAIGLSDDEKYPAESNDGSAFLQYKVFSTSSRGLDRVIPWTRDLGDPKAFKGAELITVINPRVEYTLLDSTPAPGELSAPVVAPDKILTMTTFENHGTEAEVEFINETGQAQILTQFDIVGTAIFSTGEDQREYSPGGVPEDRKTIETKFIQTSASADRLSVGLYNWYQYGDFLYSFTSNSDVAVGAIVTLTETAVTGVNITGRVVARVDRPYNGVADYTIEGMVAYSAQTPDVETKIFPVDMLKSLTDPQKMDFTVTNVETKAMRVSEIAPFVFNWYNGGDSDDTMDDSLDGGSSSTDVWARKIDISLGSFAYDDMGEGTVKVKANLLVSGDITIQGDEATIGDYAGGQGIYWNGTALDIKGALTAGSINIEDEFTVSSDGDVVANNLEYAGGSISGDIELDGSITFPSWLASAGMDEDMLEYSANAVTPGVNTYARVQIGGAANYKNAQIEVGTDTLPSTTVFFQISAMDSKNRFYAAGLPTTTPSSGYLYVDGSGFVKRA